MGNKVWLTAEEDLRKNLPNSCWANKMNFREELRDVDYEGSNLGFLQFFATTPGLANGSAPSAA